MIGERETKRNVVIELFLLSFISLYLELLIIRWMSADMRAFIVFRTFPLVTCFVGLGVGFALRKDDAYRYVLPATLLFVAIMAMADFLGVCFWGFPSHANFQWQNLVGLVSDPGWAYLIAFALVVLILLAAPFAICVGIGGRLGVLFNQLPALPAYCYNVLGAVAGSIAFPCLCHLGWAPWQLLMPCAAGLVFLSWRQFDFKVNVRNLGALAAIVPFVLFVPEQTSKPLIPEILQLNARHTTLWSPYQRLDLSAFYQGASERSQSDEQEPVFLGLELGANRAFYQYFFSREAIRHGKLAGTELLKNIASDYALAFSFNKPKDVLIVGAGTGQNVSSALDAGATTIDAVEIDPVILGLGKRFNPDYASEKVNLVCDDARHYFAVCGRKYDVVNFSTLDSHAVSGLGSSVRIDTYVYTRESFRQVLSLLKPNGLLVCSFATVAPWTKARLLRTFEQAAGYRPLCVKGNMIGTVYILGNPVKDGNLAIPKGYIAESVDNDSDTRILSDDWPYLYVRPDVIDYPYLLVVGEILLVSVFAARRFLIAKPEPLNGLMFFLGAAFMTLELHAISFLSLLYGSTWVTSAIVINGILVMILAANLLVLRFAGLSSRAPLVPYALLFCSILLSYFLPSDSLVSNGVGGYVAATLLTLLPMGIAAVVFAHGFSGATNISGALAFNLFGAVLGGLLEYLSNYLGIKSMMLVSLVLYVCSAACMWMHYRQIQNSGASGRC